MQREVCQRRTEGLIYWKHGIKFKGKGLTGSAKDIRNSKGDT